jgi:Flp pilus assembly protein TadG
MNVKPLNSEKGQAIVYLVIGLVVFLGFVALAIDGGMALADRRHDQNAADAASLAGGGKAAIDIEKYGMTTADWSCESLDFAMNNGEVAAVTRADANNFTIFRPADPKYDPNDHNSVVATCNNSGQYIDFTVEISATTPSNFLQLVFPSALHNEVEAVTRVYPGHPYAFGNAIIALNPEICSDPGSQGTIMFGNGETIVQGGGIFSNGCVRGNGASGSVTMLPITDTVPTVPAGGVYGHDLRPGNLDWNPDEYPALTSDTLEYDDYHIEPPIEAKCDINGWQSSLPEYPPIIHGLWCITGNLSINAGDVISGTNVTIYVPHGKITINGNADVQLYAPPAKPDTPLDSGALPGILWYVPDSNHNTVTINGTLGDKFSGMIYAPGSLIKVTGTSDNEIYEGQVIGWDVEIGGNTGFNILYNPDTGRTDPTSMELHR